MSKIWTDKMIDLLYYKLTVKLCRKPKTTKKDIVLILCCMLNDNFTPMYDTKLYKNHSGEYCKLLEFMEEYNPKNF